MSINFAFWSTQRDTTAEKIWSFVSLQKGWCYGSGVPAEQSVAMEATAVSTLLKSYGCEKTNAFPAEDGSILVTGYRGDHTIEVYCEVDGSFLLVIEKDNIELESGKYESILALLRSLQEKENLWRSLDFCAPSTSTVTKECTGARLFSLPVTGAAHQLLMFPV
jgi:hypothetical protein